MRTAIFASNLYREQYEKAPRSNDREQGLDFMYSYKMGKRRMAVLYG